ncbi:hypothetical protein RSSM_01757 [Rhodopirellula sallentina SM41]|uniref:Uncharacterized protein n=1 Tax=Rhodopirellula sallentina SM41 TaxID=1263870 RepID=M5U6C9_9BACT|nr:hypothetical protein RSSM_01757 [Rhodopirellula sallentina SM41]
MRRCDRCGDAYRSFEWIIALLPDRYPLLLRPVRLAIKSGEALQQMAQDKAFAKWIAR